MTIYFENPDFTVSEFLHNLVVRWEFLPGSTHILYGHRQESILPMTEHLTLGTQANNLFTDNTPHNVFLIKLSYRFGLR